MYGWYSDNLLLRAQQDSALDRTRSLNPNVCWRPGVILGPGV